MKLYFFDIVNSSYETVVDSEEYDALAAKKVTGHAYAEDEADLKWQYAGDGPYVTYGEHKQVQARLNSLEEALQRIVQWAEAYPLDVFPEPDFKRVHEVLKAAGLGLDQVSASNMRHVVKGVGDIARSALGKGANDGA